MTGGANRYQKEQHAELGECDEGWHNKEHDDDHGKDCRQRESEASEELADAAERVAGIKDVPEKSRGRSSPSRPPRKPSTAHNPDLAVRRRHPLAHWLRSEGGGP